MAEMGFKRAVCHPTGVHGDETLTALPKKFHIDDPFLKQIFQFIPNLLHKVTSFTMKEFKPIKTWQHQSSRILAGPYRTSIVGLPCGSPRVARREFNSA